MPHIHEKIDFTVHIFIVYKNKVLLRYHDKYNIWCGPSGHLDLEEDPNQAAIREAKEEVGLNIKLYNHTTESWNETEQIKRLIPPMYMNIHRISKNHRHIDLIYFATSNTDEVLPTYEEDRSDKWKWVSKEELAQMKDIRSEHKFYAEQALKTLTK